MKGCIVAALLLAAMLAGVGLNARYVCHTAETLTRGLQALPHELPPADSTPENQSGDPRADTADAVERLQATLEARTKILRLTIPTTKLGELRRALNDLKQYAAAGEQTAYTVARIRLLELCEDLADAEKLNLRSLL